MRVLDGEHVGVVDGLLDEALDRRARRSRRGGGRGCRRARIAANMSTAAAHVGAQARARLRRPRPVAQVGPVDRGERDEVGQVERPATRGTTWSASTSQVATISCSRISSDIVASTSSAHDVAEAAAAQLLLDRLEQVVGGLVEISKSASRVTRNVACSVDLHAGEERGRGASAITSSSATKRGAVAAERAGSAAAPPAPSRARTGARRSPGRRSDHAERQRQVRDVRERPARADRERRQDGEDLVPSNIAASAPRSAGVQLGERAAPRRPSPRSARQQVVVRGSLCSLDELAHAVGDRVRAPRRRQVAGRRAGGRAGRDVRRAARPRAP